MLKIHFVSFLDGLSKKNVITFVNFFIHFRLYLNPFSTLIYVFDGKIFFVQKNNTFWSVNKRNSKVI